MDSDLSFRPDGTASASLDAASLINPIAALGPGLVTADATLRPLRINLAGPTVDADVWLLWEHLGEIATAKIPGGTYTFRLPQPSEMLPWLERARGEWMNAFRANAATLRIWFPGATESTDEYLLSSMNRSSSAYLTMITVMLLYLRRRWNILPVPADGCLAGLAEEIAFYSSNLPPPDARHPTSQAVLDRFTVEVEALVARSVPHFGRPRGVIERDGSRVRELFDRERLAWYFRLRSFREVRAVRTNRYRYVALLFNGDRVVVDTAQKENRVFLWRGATDLVLAAIGRALDSPQLKQNMDQDPLCVASCEHDAEGMEELGRFLA